MLDRTKDISVAAQAWLDEFERILGRPDPSTLDRLFLADSFWRDVLALSWNLQTIAGRQTIAQALATLAPKAAPADFKI
ncbi:monooxygenase, partial [Bradyrhizobium sp. PRIMUS42]|nr:monooxygenase [Bradyrhizobium sp. PRIMUS42]